MDRETFLKEAQKYRQSNTSKMEQKELMPNQKEAQISMLKQNNLNQIEGGSLDLFRQMMADRFLESRTEE